MLHRTAPRFISRAFANRTWRYPAEHRFREASDWSRKTMGLKTSEMKLSARPQQKFERFNPTARHVTKGTEKNAWRWRYEHQAFLPNIPPPGYKAPRPLGRAAWPSGWDEEFAAPILAKSDDQLREELFGTLTLVIFNETQRDGYELRRLDFEGRPMSELPLREVIEKFAIEEDTLRERVVKKVVEDGFRFAPSSEDRSQLRSVHIIIDYIIANVTACREPSALRPLTEATKDILNSFAVQPELGFVHALPGSKWTDNTQLEEWERLYHHDWQFGKAVYTPRTEENTRGNVVWLRLEEEWRQRQAWEESLRSGAAKEAHLRLIREAAHA